MDILLPAIWLIVLIVGLPQLSETVYTPSLPDIADGMKTSEAMVEYTLTIYLLGFAIGTLFWGIVSDKIGRKPCVLVGLLIFIVGCIGCYYSSTITELMIARFVQAFGGSIGSIIGQAICRDAFHGQSLGKAYSLIGAALAVFPAIGPVLGGFIAQNFGWPTIFLFLTGFALILNMLVLKFLPETHHAENRKHISIITVAKALITDINVIGFGLIVAACNGITFSYFAEGSFYFIKILGLSASQYGLSFVPIAVVTMMGGIISKYLHHWYTSQTIMRYGLRLLMLSTALFTTAAFSCTHYALFSFNTMIFIAIIMQMITMFSICIITSNALALSLAHYKWCTGTASSLFGFFYYLFISFFTFGMGSLHDGTLLAMPLYFFALSCGMFLVEKFMISKQ